MKKTHLRFLLGVIATLILAGRGSGPRDLAANGRTGCATAANPIVCENALPAPSENWWVEGFGDTTIQGFASNFSIDRSADTIDFKIKTDSTNYRIDVYRLGYYGGEGARRVGTSFNDPNDPNDVPSVVIGALPQVQPPCISESATGLYDCGNWAVSASWTLPSTTVSGVHIAKLTRLDGSLGASHIVFVVRDDARTAAMLVQTSDTTWQAYNRYGGVPALPQGGASLYCGGPVSNAGTAYTCAGRAAKVSYNRPFDTAVSSPGSWLFSAEYPFIRFLEANGYDVEYWSGIDTDRFGSQLSGAAKPKVFLPVGHDEYWSGDQRGHVEAARNAGVNLAFFSGNEVFWKTRWENSINGTATPFKTLVTYKETLANAKIDPNPAWTGTWRDPRFSPPSDGGRPENQLVGSIWTVNSGTTAIQVPAALKNMRFWRNTSVAQLAANQVETLGTGTLGYEWGEDLDNGFRPSGLVQLSSTTVPNVEKIIDYGSQVGIGTATHSLTLYRHNTLDQFGNITSSALVFGASTVQWSWGLDNFGSAQANATMRQATVNLFADMNVQPGSLQLDIQPATGSSDTIPPTSTIDPVVDPGISPPQSNVVRSGNAVTITGAANDGGGVVGAVEVSVDGGATWRRANGRSTWSIAWTPGLPGTAVIRTRAIDDSGNIETQGPSVTVTITDVNSTCPCTSLWNPATITPGTTTPATVDVGPDAAVELGVKFKSDLPGYITGVRFFKSTGNTGTHIGNLWTTAGVRLATATFTNETASGWQTVTFNPPVAIAANKTYVASYHTTVGHYTETVEYFANAGVDSPPLHAPRAILLGGNGVYRYGPSGYPTNTFRAKNYWVDVIINTSTSDQTGPAISAVTAVPGPGGTATISWTTDEPSTSRVEFGTSPAALTGPAATNPLVTSHSVVLSGLAPHTTYHYRVTSADGADNSSTSSTASFVMPAASFADTLVADFANGKVQNARLAQADNGEIILGPQSAEEFNVDGVLPAGWTSCKWINGATCSGAGGVLVQGGSVKVDGARLDTNQSSSPTRSLEFNATFASDAFQHVGFGATATPFINPPWAIFSTSTGNGQLFARTNSGAAVDETLIPGTWTNAEHRFRIEWNATKVAYYIDGALVATHTIAIAVNMQAIAASDFTQAAGNVLVHSLSLSPTYAASGLFESRVFDAGQVTNWGPLTWNAGLPPGTALALSVRRGNTAVPDGTWSAFAPVPQGGTIGGSSRYLQYRAELATSDPTKTPSLQRVSITHENTPLPVDTTPPVISNLTATPAGTTTAVVTWNTDEPTDSRVDYGPTTALGSSTYDAALVTSHSVTLTGLSVATTYNFKATSVDPAGNSATQTSAVTFTTKSFAASPFVDKTAADFGAGTPGAGALVTQMADGEVILKPAINEEFNGPVAGWNSFTGTAVPVVGGFLNVDAERVGTVASFGPGRSLEFVATFGADTFQHVGFVDDFNSFSAYAMFSTKDTVNTVFARTSDGVFTDVGALVGAPHRYRIDWNASNVAFWVDGVPLATHAFAHGGNLRPIASDAFNGTGLSVDWLRMGPYSTSATFVSRVLDAGGRADWGNLNWNAEMPADTTLALSVRTGNTPTPGGDTWSTFTSILAGGAIPGISRYIQYQAQLTSTGLTTPVLNDVTIDFVAATGTNTAAAANDDAYTVNEDTTLTVPAKGVLANDTDAENDALTAILTLRPLNGSVALNSNGSFSYAPAHNFSGTDSFKYMVNDGTVDSNQALVTITIVLTNDNPVAVNDTHSVAEDSSAVQINVLANDLKEPGETLSVIAVGAASHGAVSFTATGVNYTPTLNYFGPDSFTYTISDGLGGTATATVNVTVTPVNDNPTATADTATVAEDSKANAINVLANDSIAPDTSEVLTVNSVTQGTNGSVVITPNGAGVTYEPKADFFGTDSFVYMASDGNGGTATATVNVTVTGVNDAPKATGDAYTVNEGGTLTQAVPGVLVNDTDVDNVSLTAILVTGPTNGTLTLNANGSFVYTHNGSETTSDSFTYKASDGAAESTVVTVTITVQPVNDAPVAAADSYPVAEGGTLNQAAPGVLANDTDVENNALTAIKVTDPSNGTLTLNANGSFAYVHNGSETTSDSFTYKANDGAADSGVVTVTITVTPVNDAPVATAQTHSIAEDTPTAITLTGSDAENSPLTFSVVSLPSQGTLTGTAPNLTYTPSANYNGPDTFTFKANDGTVDSNVATIAISVTAVNDAPSFTKGTDQSVFEGSGAQTVTGWATALSAGPADETGQTLDFIVTNDNNTLFAVQPSIAPAGTLTYTPAASATGSATVVVRIHDNGGTANGGVDVSGTQTFVITVIPNVVTTTRVPTSSLNPSTYGQAVTFSTVVERVSGGLVTTGAVTFYDSTVTPNIALGTASVDAAGGASITTNLVAVGTRSIIAVYNGSPGFKSSTSGVLTQTVNKASATSSMTISATSKQYSDLMTYEVTVSGANGETPAQGVNFKIGTQQMNAGPVPFVNMGGGIWKATLANNPLLESGTPGALKPTGTSKIVSASYVSASANYTLATPTSKALLITKEDARVAYSGPTTVTTAGGSTATIPLQADVRDITNTPDAGTDSSAGDIRLAQVMFVNRATGAMIATVTVSLDPADPNKGIASYNWNVDIGANTSQTFTVGFVVTNYYNRNSTTDNASVVVRKP